MAFFRKEKKMAKEKKKAEETRFIYLYKDEEKENGKTSALIELIREDNTNGSFLAFQEMVVRLRKTFPQAELIKIQCAILKNGRIAVRWYSFISDREYPGWEKKEGSMTFC